MEDVPLSQIRKETGIGLKELREKLKTFGIKQYLIRDKKHIEKSDYDRLMKEINLPEQLQVKTAKAQYLYDCKNPRFIYAKVDGYDGKKLVLLTRRKWGKMLGKSFTVEVIEDKDGTSFRHIDFMKRYKIGK